MGIVSYLPAIGVSLLLHALVIVLVFKGWGATEPPKIIQSPAYIKATLVDLKTQGIKSAPKSTAKPKPVPKKINLEKKRKEAAKKQAADKKRKQQLAKKKADAKAKNDKLKKQKLAKKKALAAKKAQAKALKDKQVLQEQAKAKAAALEAQRRQEKLQRERARLQAELQAELSAVALEEDNIATLSYADAIGKRVKENWSRPPSARNGMKVDLRIQLVPTGTIVNVAVLKSSGNAAFDRSAIRAINKVGQFPEIKTMPSRIFEQNFRQFTFRFEPEDLRQ